MTELEDGSATLSPARIELLKIAVDTQERMLTGCSLIFSGLRQHPDADVSGASQAAYDAIENHRAVLEALIDGLHATRH